MPTGYTAPVEDGSITDLSDFILVCARGLSPLITLRDSDQSLEATRRYLEREAYLDNGDYYQTDLVDCEARLAELEQMSDEEVIAAAQAEADERARSNERLALDTEIKRKRYEAMLAKVGMWEPPTSDHVELREFMLRQLRESLDYLNPFTVSGPEVNLTWRTTQIVRLQARIAESKVRIAEQQERNESRRAWVEALLGSLEQAHATDH